MNLADPEISSIWREIDISSHKTDNREFISSSNVYFFF